MVCKYCNSQNSSDAIFCYQCGRKLYGIYCPECDTHNEDGSLYCANCGARLDKNRVCSHCGAELNPNAVYCSYCGEMLGAKVAQTSSKNSADLKKESPTPSDTPNIFKTIANSLGIAIAALTIIFTLFMGTKGITALNSSGEEATATNVFYYFGKVWSDINSMASTIPLYNTGIAVLYTKAAIGAVISAASLLAVLILSIIAIVKCATAIKSGKMHGGKAIVAFSIFVAGSLCLLMLDNAFMRIDVTSYSWYPFPGNSSGSSRTNTINAFCKLNASTVAGLIIITALVIAYVVLAILANGKKNLNLSLFLNGLFVIGSIIFATILAGFTTSSFLSINGISGSAGMSYPHIEGDISFNPLDFLLFVADSNDTAISYGDTTRFLLIIALMTVAFVLLCAAILLAMLTIGFNLKGLTDSKHSKNKGSLIIAVFAAVLSIAAYAMIKGSLNMYDAELIELNYRFPMYSMIFGYPSNSYERGGLSTFNGVLSYTPLKVIMGMAIVMLCIEVIRTITNAIINKMLRSAIEE